MSATSISALTVFTATGDAEIRVALGTVATPDWIATDFDGSAFPFTVTRLIEDRGNHLFFVLLDDTFFLARIDEGQDFLFSHER